MARKRVLAALDIGTSKVLAVVAEPDGGTFRTCGVGAVPSAGVRRGTVVDLEAAAASVGAALQRAQRMAGERISSVILGFSGGQVASWDAEAAVDVAESAAITPGDVDHVLAAVRPERLAPGRELVHVIPRHYAIDGLDGVRDPVGLSGRELAVEAHLVACAAGVLQNVWKAVSRAGVEVSDLALNGLAAAEAVLLPDERELGVALLDLGAGATDVVVFRGGAPVRTAVVPLGGDAITADIAVGLRTSLAAAEELKRAHGLLPDERLTVPPVAEGDPHEASGPELVEIVTARLEEILEAARSQVEGGPLPGGVVLTGGGAELRGAVSVAMRVFGHGVRLGSPRGCGGMDRLETPACAAGVGLLHLAAARGAPVPEAAARGLRAWWRRVF